uniref:Uncharacterized protein n=1 Tax=Arundo donax TaxID=35708 RepID=A0A0A8ZR90_ARUDO
MPPFMDPAGFRNLPFQLIPDPVGGFGNMPGLFDGGATVPGSRSVPYSMSTRSRDVAVNGSTGSLGSGASSLALMASVGPKDVFPNNNRMFGSFYGQGFLSPQQEHFVKASCNGDVQERQESHSLKVAMKDVFPNNRYGSAVFSSCMCLPSSIPIVQKTAKKN